MPMPIKDLTGQKFYKLTAIRISRKTTEKYKNIIWLCLCDCGTEVEVPANALRKGSRRSCGCASYARHGMKGTRTYVSYIKMKARCLNEKDPKYPLYGGRGIAVCQRWKDSFLNFLADMGEAPAGHTIDRINNNKGYFPENCRWATPFAQSNNRRCVPLIEINGERKTLSEWAIFYGINRDTVSSRLYKGVPVIEALTRPLRYSR